MSRRMVSAVFVVWVLAGVCAAQENVARMEQVIQSYVDAKQFMGSVLVARDTAVLLDKGYGFANLEWQIPNSPKTRFRLGSITKQFTAASILLLEERGKITLDAPVKTYMPDAPAAWDKVTIFHLLTHTSGIPSFTSFPDYAAKEAFATTPQELVARFRDKPLEFQPGEKWNYNNSGYVLLGYLIEKISGQNYSRFVQENIFNPLGMKDSGYDSNTAIIPNRAAGYTPGEKGIVNAGYIDMTIPFSAGALYSTTEDLLRWEQGLMGGKVLSPASLQKMTTAFKNGYAFGLFVQTANGRKSISHGGGIEGFNAALTYYPDDKVTVIVLSNLNGPADKIAANLGSVVHGENVTLAAERKEIDIPRSILASYAGVYEIVPGFDLAISLQGDQLAVQGTGQPQLPLFAESETKFFLKAVDAQIDFVKNEKGEVNSLVLHQNGTDAKGTRKSK